MKSENIYIFLLLLLIMTSCSLNQEDGHADGSEIGLISEINSKSILEVDWFELESEDLSTKRFYVEDQIKEFTPTHFRYHMITGEFVKVDYREEGGLLIAVNVQDID